MVTKTFDRELTKLCDRMIAHVLDWYTEEGKKFPVKLRLKLRAEVLTFLIEYNRMMIVEIRPKKIK